MQTCEHLDQIRDVLPRTDGCEECLATGQTWVHLRMCATCGHVGCCDSSTGRHATRHYLESNHPIMRSAEPGESWGWCYADGLMLEDDELAAAPASRPLPVERDGRPEFYD